MAGKCLKFKEVYKPSLGKKVKVCQHFGEIEQDFDGFDGIEGLYRDCLKFTCKPKLVKSKKHPEGVLSKTKKSCRCIKQVPKGWTDTGYRLKDYKYTYKTKEGPITRTGQKLRKAAKYGHTKAQKDSTGAQLEQRRIFKTCATQNPRKGLKGAEFKEMQGRFVSCLRSKASQLLPPARRMVKSKKKRS